MIDARGGPGFQLKPQCEFDVAAKFGIHDLERHDSV